MSRLLAAALAALTAGVLAGCGDDAAVRGGGNVAGKALAVYGILPLTGQYAPTSQELIEGAKLALVEREGKVNRFEIGFATVDETRQGPAEAARRAIGDLQTIAAFGASTEKSARRGMPLLNAAGIGLVGVGAADAKLSSQARFSPAGSPSFVSLVPDLAAQAGFIASNEDSERVAVVADASREGVAMADALREALGERLVRQPSRARLVIYAGSDAETAAAALEDLAEEAPGARLMVTDALLRVFDLDSLPAKVRSRTGAYPAVAPPSAEFASAFEAAYGRAPGRYSELGYEAMRTILGAIDAAKGRGRNRAAVIEQLLAAEPQPAMSRELPPGRPQPVN